MTVGVVTRCVRACPRGTPFQVATVATHGAVTRSSGCQSASNGRPLSASNSTPDTRPEKSPSAAAYVISGGAAFEADPGSNGMPNHSNDLHPKLAQLITNGGQGNTHANVGYQA